MKFTFFKRYLVFPIFKSFTVVLRIYDTLNFALSMYFPAFGLNAKYISVRVNETKITTENTSNQARFGLDQPRPYRNFF